MKHSTYDRDLRQMRIGLFVMIALIGGSAAPNLIFHNWLIGATSIIWAACVAMQFKLIRIMQGQRDANRLLQAILEEEKRR